MSRNRVVAAAVVVAAGIGVPGSALALGSGTAGSKPTTSPAAATVAAAKIRASSGPSAPAPKAGLPNLSALAASAHITESQLQAGLEVAKNAGGNTMSGVAAFARTTGVSATTAQRIVSSIFNTPVIREPTSAAAAAALATQLGVSSAATQSALEQLGTLARAQGIDPNSAAFAAIAHRLGVAPTRLAAALPLVKQALRPAGG
jgi:hypothetical protein